MMQSVAVAAPLASRREPKVGERERMVERRKRKKRRKERERGGREAWREDLHSWNKLQRTMEGDRHVEGIQIKEVEDVKKSMRPSELLRPSGVTFDPARATIMIISRDIDNIKNVSSPLRNEISSRMCLSFRHARMLHENINMKFWKERKRQREREGMVNARWKLLACMKKGRTRFTIPIGRSN